MPGLLETPPGYFATTKFFYALIAECLGTMMFALVAGASQYVAANLVTQGGPNYTMAAFGNGFGLMIAVFATANISGGHINPAVTLATMLTGNMEILNGTLYMAAQLLGSIFASLVLVGLVPGAAIGMGNSGPGCFGPGAGQAVNNAQLFGWELFGTFILVSVIYAVAIGPNSFGNVAPLAVGLTLTGAIFMGAAFTGGAFNPARAIGPSCVFHCNWDKIGYFVLGEVVGGLSAGAFGLPLYGGRSSFFSKYMPWTNMNLEHHRRQNASTRSNGEVNANVAPNHGAEMEEPKV